MKAFRLKPGRRSVLAVLLCATIALAPALAEARAGSRAGGGGGSFSSRSTGGMQSPSLGSRGSRTYDYNGARPIERSTTPAPSRPAATPSPGFGTGFGGGFGQAGFMQRHPFLTGIAGGFVGSWLGGMLFGHSPAMAAGTGTNGNIVDQGQNASPTGSLLGSLLPFLLLLALAWVGFKLFRRVRQPSLAQVSRYDGEVLPPPVALPSAGMPRALGGAVPSVQSLALSEDDQEAFAELLTGIQTAWSKGEIDGLKTRVTPEMLDYFREALANNVSRGVENHVDQVNPLDLDVREVWSEGGLDYVTAQMTWSALDYTFRLDRKPGDADYLFDGNPTQPQQATEVWTLVRSPGGRWLLSAVQQV